MDTKATDTLFFGREGMSEEFRQYMAKVMMVQLSSENSIVRLFTTVTCPEIDYFQELAETAAGESMHSRGIARALQELGYDPEPIIESARFGKAEKMLDILRDPRPRDYDEVNVLRWLSERAGGFQSITLFGCRYIPYACFAAQNYMDEGEGHPDNAKNMLRTPSPRDARRGCRSIWILFTPWPWTCLGGAGARTSRTTSTWASSRYPTTSPG